MQIEWDKEIDALYIKLSDQAVSYSKEFSISVAADFAEDGTLVGLDIQKVSDILNGENGLVSPPAAAATGDYDIPRLVLANA